MQPETISKANKANAAKNFPFITPQFKNNSKITEKYKCKVIYKLLLGGLGKKQGKNAGRLHLNIKELFNNYAC